MTDQNLFTKRDVGVALLLGLLAFAVFSRAVGYGFVNFDDPEYVYQNAHVARGLSTAGVKYALTTCDIGTWAPLTWLSYELDGSLSGMQPSSFHATNLVFHCLAGGLLMLVLRTLGQTMWVSATVALLFLVHPLREESVVWIAERKDVLCAFFWMGGLLAYAHYVRRPGAARWWLVLGCFIGGLLSKMMMVTFPLVLLLLDFWPLGRLELTGPGVSRQIRPLLTEKAWFFALSVAALVTTSLALRSHGAFSAREPEGLTGLLRVPQNYLFYLRKIFWPSELSVLYPLTPVQALRGVLSGGVLAVLTVMMIAKRRTLPGLFVGWLWFLITLVPVVGFFAFGDFTVADRYTYLPSVGIAWGIVATAELLWPAKNSMRWMATLATGIACALLTWEDLPRWRDSLSLTDAAIRVGPHYVSLTNRGAARLQAGAAAGALEDFEAAIRLNPRFATAYNDRGSILSDQGKYEEAIRDFDQAIALNHYFADAYGNRANALARKGQPEQSLADYQRCIQLAPDNPMPFNNRAAAYLQLKRLGEAQADLATCVHLGGHPHPGLVQAVDDALKAGTPQR